LSLALRSNSMTRFSYGASLRTSGLVGVQICLQVSRSSIGYWLESGRAAAHLTAKYARCVECGKCKTYPATSRVISLTKAVLFDRKPFLREILGPGVLGVTSVGVLSVSFARAVGKFVVGNTYGGQR